VVTLVAVVVGVEHSMQQLIQIIKQLVQTVVQVQLF
jgi:hypothetical protein